MPLVLHFLKARSFLCRSDSQGRVPLIPTYTTTTKTRLMDETPRPPPIAKKPWMPPKIMLLPLSHISNNSMGGGDGDAALAHS